LGNNRGRSAGPREIYAAVSEEIWKTWRRSAAGPNKKVAGDGRHRGIP